MKPNKTLFVYDVEQFANFHSLVAYDVIAKKTYQFAVCDLRDDRIAYFKFLKDNSHSMWVGFNNINYDYPLLHFMLFKMKGALHVNTQTFNSMMYTESQNIINSDYSVIKYPKLYQLDLFRLHHYNNKARMTSLKALQFAMGWDNLQELPYLHSDTSIGSTQETLDNMLEYNKNDTMSTYEFYNHSKNELKTRKIMKSIYNRDFYSTPDATMGYDIFLDELSKSTGKSIQEIKKYRTERPLLYGYNIITKLITSVFNVNSGSIFQSVFDYFNSIEIHEDTKVGTTFIHDNNGKPIQYHFGLGGIHASIEPQLVESDNDYIIIDSDIVSFYPMLAIKYGFHPKQFDKQTFINTYQNLFNERTKYPKKTHFAQNYAIKIALNSVYGKSNDKYSALYDKLMTYQITINGQLFICMFIQEVLNTLKDITVIQANTDGVTFKMLKSDYNEYLDICSAWELLSKLKLEHAEYSRMWIRDVNNYLAEYKDGSVKHKGDFEIEKPFHKDQSMTIVTKAVVLYFLHGIPIKNTIESCTNIFDFFISQKVGKQFKVEYHTTKNGASVKIPMQRLNRFYVSNSGGGLIKVKGESSNHRLVAGKSVIVMNKIITKPNFKDYDIDYNYYINKANKLSESVLQKQTKLF